MNYDAHGARCEGSTSSDSSTIEIEHSLEELVYEPAPQHRIIKCQITREKKGVGGILYPTYYLHIEQDDGRSSFLLAGRQRKKSTTSNYLISNDLADLSRRSDTFIGKLRSNLLGTQYTVYDNGENPKKPNVGSRTRRELAVIEYDTNVLGLKGPRKMTCVIPGMGTDNKRVEVQPTTDDDGILGKWKRNEMENLMVLHNKKPVWREDIESHVLNFNGRATTASIKNCQMVNENDVDYIVMQLGRIGEDVFTMDFRYPMCALQAFAIALSNFENKLARQ